MKTKLVIITLILCIAASCTKKVYIPLNTVTTITERLVDTVIKVNLQVYRDTITTPDTISHLVNPYCESWARVSGGLLRHSLTSSKEPIDVKVVYKDVVRVDSIPVPVPIEKKVYIEKKLSQWQSIRMRIGEIAIGAVGILLIIWLIKRKI
jgi:hypothetical protein